ncbi:hypothetical protein DFH07DRAFT_210692 [Mycena maculata]|uniref:Protein kinase domain-containing protein n=1 Tax=Mycena maculata TaxID=230809 RepID=A0AAD7P1H3_9AGAR|nr:hypothetical protein DFH07DRAFT_210692 [Mycena maculata]
MHPRLLCSGLVLQRALSLIRNHSAPALASSRRPAHRQLTGAVVTMEDLMKYVAEGPPTAYQPGTILSARPHTPPLPPNFHYTFAQGELEVEMALLHESDPLELCLKHPPTRGRLRAGPVQQLKILDHIKVSTPALSQIVKVEPLPETGGEQRKPRGWPRSPPAAGIAAKLYDPRYVFRHRHPDYADGARAYEHLDPVHALYGGVSVFPGLSYRPPLYGRWPDVFANCNADYAHEARAYKYLRPLYGSVVPHFYGAFAVDVPLPDDPARTRPVQAILYEYIPGVVLASIKRSEYTRWQRQAIMSAILDADSKLWQLDVTQRDMHPRNVILVDAGSRKRGSGTVPADIRLIDFGRADCGQRAKKDGGYQPTVEPEPSAQVIQRWLDGRVRDFDWLIDWPWDLWLLDEYWSTRSRVR